MFPIIALGKCTFECVWMNLVVLTFLQSCEIVRCFVFSWFREFSDVCLFICFVLHLYGYAWSPFSFKLSFVLFWLFVKRDIMKLSTRFVYLCESQCVYAKCIFMNIPLYMWTCIYVRMPVYALYGICVCVCVRAIGSLFVIIISENFSSVLFLCWMQHARLPQEGATAVHLSALLICSASDQSSNYLYPY